MRGRKKTPAKILQLRNNPGKRPINQDEPKFKPGIPEAPAFLSETARKYWHLHLADLDDTGILARVDLGIFAAYSTALANLELAEINLQRFGYVQINDAGLETKMPWVLIAKESRDEIRSLGSELGLTPASRARLKVTPKVSDKQGAKRFLA